MSALMNGHDINPAPKPAQVPSDVQQIAVQPDQQFNFVLTGAQAMIVLQILHKQPYEVVAPTIHLMLDQLRAQSSPTPAGPS